MRVACAVAVLGLLTGGCAPQPVGVAESAPKATDKFFPAQSDGRADLYRAIADARASSRRAVIVFGADWCHDSLALAKLLRSPAFQSEFGSRYSVTMIDVGKPQTGAGRNLELVQRFGIVGLSSTPVMVVIDRNGKALNSAIDAVSWRNADGRKTADVLAWFRALK